METMNEIELPKVDKFISLPDTAKLLCCSVAKLYQMMDAGLLKSVKVGRSRRVPVSEIARYQAALIAAAE